MSHKAGHIIIFNAMEAEIPMTPLKVRDIIGALIGFGGGWWFF